MTTVVATPGQGPDRPQEVSYTDIKVSTELNQDLNSVLLYVEVQLYHPATVTFITSLHTITAIYLAAVDKVVDQYQWLHSDFARRFNADFIAYFLFDILSQILKCDIIVSVGG